jgi:two-component system cell cycle sensor histidine kinase/response regulator CckA
VLDLKSYHLRSSQIETSLELHPALPETCFDAQQIEQVVLNMLNNGEQAITSVRRTGTIVLRTGIERELIWLEVVDDGPGVPEEVRDRIFDPFFSTKELGKGTGLGLSVSYGIVQEHGGWIELRPSTGRGATMRFYLPVVEGPSVSDMPLEIEIEADSGSLRGRRVLVAEDEPMVAELFARLLTQEGVEVSLAQDGEEAWERMGEIEFDLVIADLRMPKVSGQELYERVAVERPDLMRRFVFATGDMMRQETQAFLKKLPNRILTKPLQLETVRRVLTQALDAR